MRLIDADAFDKCLEGAEIEATKNRKYVFSSAINTIRGNLANFPPVNQWISCDERLPEDGPNILICDINGNIEVAHLSRLFRIEFFSPYGDKIENVKAWMPLPEPYKEEKE